MLRIANFLLVVAVLAAPRPCNAAQAADSHGPGRAEASIMQPGSLTVPPVEPSAPKAGPNHHSLAQSPDSTIAIPADELTLDQAIKIGIANHPKMKEAAAETSAAGEKIGEARSYLGPQLYGTAQYLRSTDNGIGNTNYYDPEGAFPRMTGINHDLPVNDFSQSSDTSNNYMGGVALSQFLFDFGRRHGYVAQRQFEAAAAASNQRLTELDLIFEISDSYFKVLQAKQLIGVYEQAVEQRKYHLHEAQVKADAGLRPQLDTYVTQAELERSQMNLLDARNSYADARVGLDNAMGLSDSAPSYHLADVLGYTRINDDLPALIKEAAHARPDLKALRDQAAAMGAKVTEYKSDYYPVANAVAGYAGMGTGLPAANNFNAGIVITWPIFNSFLTRDQIAEADYTRHSIEAAIEDLRQQIILQVQTAFLNWQDAAQRIKFAGRALDASRVELELAQKRYETGLTDIVELEDAQRHYTEDDANYANALYGFALTKAAVDQATARSLRDG